MNAKGMQQEPTLPEMIADLQKQLRSTQYNARFASSAAAAKLALHEVARLERLIRHFRKEQELAAATADLPVVGGQS